MEPVLTIFLAILGSTGISTIIVACLNRRWAKQDRKDSKMDAVVNGLKVLTTAEVRSLGKEYVSAQAISLGDKENIEEMYQAYKKLGGNGHLDTIMSEVEKLPISD